MTSAPWPSVIDITAGANDPAGTASGSAPHRTAAAALSAVRDVPMQRAPRAAQTCAAAVPTPLATAWMSAVSPSCRPPRSTRPWNAVMNTSGMAAASSKDMPSGTGTQFEAGAVTSSAYAPPGTRHITRSPRVTAAPGGEVSTSPTASRPRMSLAPGGGG